MRDQNVVAGKRCLQVLVTIANSGKDDVPNQIAASVKLVHNPAQESRIHHQIRAHGTKAQAQFFDAFSMEFVRGDCGVMASRHQSVRNVSIRKKVAQRSKRVDQDSHG